MKKNFRGENFKISHGYLPILAANHLEKSSPDSHQLRDQLHPSLSLVSLCPHSLVIPPLPLTCHPSVLSTLSSLRSLDFVIPRSLHFVILPQSGRICFCRCLAVDFAVAARYSEASASRLTHHREAASSLPKAGVQPKGRNDESIAVAFACSLSKPSKIQQKRLSSPHPIQPEQNKADRAGIVVILHLVK